MKVLVANRSEIACRIFQTAKEMGFSTVAIFAPGDEKSRHVFNADEAYSVRNYLDIESIVTAVNDSGADLVHPGYGFLSERSEFVSALAKTKATFVGPRAETITQLGDKIQAKALAEKSGVNTLPWSIIKDLSGISEVAKKVGYPLLIKAAAGGGGKGMRLVEKESDLKELAEMASSEALSSFGDGILFLEKYVSSPRHIEVQVFGDGKGGGIHLFERECSLQRRNQKVWEESPAPNLSNKTKKLLYQSSLNIVRSTKYLGAGTVEFLVDDQEQIYFLEVNTRLQVEHPVTEEVTGLDLVKIQLELSSGKIDSLDHINPTLRGAAIEVRLYSESPYQGYLPTSGKIDFLKWPLGKGIRIETGIELGVEVNTSYDPMLAKLIVFDFNRESALRKMNFALSETVILGMGTNQAFLYDLTNHQNVIDGKLDTGFLQRDIEVLRGDSDLNESDLNILVSLFQNTAATIDSIHGSQIKINPFIEVSSKLGDGL